MQQTIKYTYMLKAKLFLFGMYRFAVVLFNELSDFDKRLNPDDKFTITYRLNIEIPRFKRVINRKHYNDQIAQLKQSPVIVGALKISGPYADHVVLNNEPPFKT